MKAYFVIEHQIRPDGEINVSETRRTTYASALSYYHERYSKMVMNEQFLSVAIMLVDESLDILERNVIATQYVPPVEKPETTEEETETSEEEPETTEETE